MLCYNDNNKNEIDGLNATYEIICSSCVKILKILMHYNKDFYGITDKYNKFLAASDIIK